MAASMDTGFGAVGLAEALGRDDSGDYPFQRRMSRDGIHACVGYLEPWIRGKMHGEGDTVCVLR